MRYETLISRAYETPWAILESKLASIVQFLNTKAASPEELLSSFELADKQGEGRKENDPWMWGSTAIIPLQGTIFPKANMMTDFSGGASADMFRKHIMDAVKNKEVKSIVLDVDSPGGSVLGIAEAAETVRRANDFKPVTAAVNGIAASATYWIASQAGRIELTPSGGVGSIGVRMMHKDYSEAEKARGVKTTVISAGKHKADGNPFEPLSKLAREHFQEEVDKIHTKFIQAVAMGRGVPEGVVRSGFGQGAMVMADEALESGMIDAISDFNSTVHAVEKGNITASSRDRIQTKRDYEGFLRDAGFSRTEAKSLSSSFDVLQRDAEDWSDVQAVVDKHFRLLLEE